MTHNDIDINTPWIPLKISTVEPAPAVKDLDILQTVTKAKDLILGDGALLYIAYVMLIWAPLIPATRWSCSRPLAASNVC